MDSSEWKKTMGEIKASLAKISDSVWEKRMGEIRANIALFSKAMGLPPLEFHSTVVTPQPKVAMTANTTMAATEERSKVKATTNIRSTTAPLVNGPLDQRCERRAHELIPQNIKADKLKTVKRGLAATHATMRQDLAADKQERRSVHKHVSHEVQKNTWIEGDDDESKEGERYEVLSAISANNRKKRLPINKSRKRKKKIDVFRRHVLDIRSGKPQPEGAMTVSLPNGGTTQHGAAKTPLVRYGEVLIGNSGSSCSGEPHIRDCVSNFKRKPRLQGLGQNKNFVPCKNQHTELPKRCILRSQSKEVSLKQSNKWLLEKYLLQKTFQLSVADKLVTFLENDELLRLRSIRPPDIGRDSCVVATGKDLSRTKFSGNKQMSMFNVDSTTLAKQNHKREYGRSERSAMYYRVGQNWSDHTIALLQIPRDEYYNSHNVPEFEDDPDLYVNKPIKYVGIEVWQVKADAVFENIVNCDDPDYAKQVVEVVFANMQLAKEDIIIILTLKGKDVKLRVRWMVRVRIAQFPNFNLEDKVVLKGDGIDVKRDEELGEKFTYSEEERERTGAVKIANRKDVVLSSMGTELRLACMDGYDCSFNFR